MKRSMVVFLLLSVICACIISSQNAYASIEQERIDGLLLAHDYVYHNWTPQVDGYNIDGGVWNHIFYPNTSYQGVAYWIHANAWDTIATFQNHIDYPYSHPDSLWRPRHNTGIDCSGLVSRNWGCN